MPTKTIAQALFSWREDGKSRIAFRGDTVDIPADVIARVEQHGVFDVPVIEAPPEPDPAPAAAPEVHAPAVDAPKRPRATAPEADWTEYAVALYKASNGVLGLDAGAAALLDREALITALAEQEN